MIRAFDSDDPECVKCGLPYKDRVGRYVMDSLACPWCGSRPKPPMEYIDGKGEDGYVRVEEVFNL